MLLNDIHKSPELHVPVRNHETEVGVLVDYFPAHPTALSCSNWGEFSA